eukprot:gene1978-2662_t
MNGRAHGGDAGDVLHFGNRAMQNCDGVAKREAGTPGTPAPTSAGRAGAHIEWRAGRRSTALEHAMPPSTPPPLFTVVMPCFRAAATIGAAIASVLEQSEPRLELIVVDDGSPDGSIAAALAAIGDDPRGRVIRQTNAGPSAARNRGAAAGCGAFIAFLDADDRWHAACLARHRAHFAGEPGLGLSFGRVRFFDAALAIPGRISAHHARPGLAAVLAENPLCSTSNMVVRRDVFAALGGFDCGLRHAEDQEFVVRLLATTPWTAAGIDAELVHYRTSPGGLSADLGAMARGWQAMLER